MPFRIYHQTPYYSQSAHAEDPRSQGEWDAYKYCGAVKSRSINGYCTLPGNVRVNQQTVSRARQHFGQFLAGLLNGRGDVYLVPSPSKDSWDTPEFRSLAMLREALPHLQNRLFPVVRFIAQRDPASQGGARGYDAVYPHLKVQNAPGFRRVIVIDDILTSGGTMLAVRRRLMDAGHQVLFGVACGRTTHQHLTPFHADWEDVDDTARSLPFLTC